ncbi:MAG: hypothetical protein GY952_12610 [Rhodobacteraceae bacterium]|nr:hypothetical protein [Paracoccaceae bacterium]
MPKRIMSALAVGAFVLPNIGTADGIVSKIVNAPLSATGTVANARVGINVYLQKPDAMGIEFMDPNVVGYGIPPGGSLEIEMAEGFERDWDVALTQSAIMLVTGAPQQGLPGKVLGYTVQDGEDENTFLITPSDEAGLPAEQLMSPAPGAKGDPVPNKGIKVIHIGFQQSAFFNMGGIGKVTVRIKDATGAVVDSGGATLEFDESPVAQILPTNFPQKRRNHNWQSINSGDTTGQTEGTLPLTYMIYGQSPADDVDTMYAFKGGLEGVGVLSTPQLNQIGYSKPEVLERYNGGLVLQDTNGDGTLDPSDDTIIGGIIASAPAGAKGQELKSLETDGTPVLSVLTEKMAPKPGKRWGGSMLMLQFTGGDKPGKYRPTVALLKNSSDLASADGASYTYTIEVK